MGVCTWGDQTLMGPGMDTELLAEANALAGAGPGQTVHVRACQTVHVDVGDTRVEFHTPANSAVTDAARLPGLSSLVNLTGRPARQGVGPHVMGHSHGVADRQFVCGVVEQDAASAGRQED